MAKYLTLIQDAVAELLGQKLRTFLTMLGMIFGVGSVIAMLNIGEGAENEALKLIDSMGVNNIIVNAKNYDKEQLSEIREESLGLNLGDIKAALATLPFVEGYSASKDIDVYDIYSDFNKSQAQALGVTVSNFANANMQLSAGRF
jgi:putative ABC transport system permease protein